MDEQALIEWLKRSSGVIHALCDDVDPEQAIWRPRRGAWSIVEIVAHLRDEERDDFRVRLGLLLRDPDANWPAIDPEGWAKQRAYDTLPLNETLSSFLDEREHSLAWLRHLESPEWKRMKPRPQGAKLYAGDLLASWVAHDWLHIRQITQRHFEFIRRLSEPYGTDYAGSWPNLAGGGSDG
jgi:hypothetical protein